MQDDPSGLKVPKDRSSESIFMRRRPPEQKPSVIDPDELLLAYRLGLFPMAESRTAKHVLWVRPDERGIIPLERFHVPRRLARTIRSDRFEVRIDTAFADVVASCAQSVDGRRETWINAPIVDVFMTLHQRGQAHSVETWLDGKLVGGLYGLSLGGAFFAESKFSRATDASKVALVHLAARLKAGGYTLLDAQFPNPHLEQFGAIGLSHDRFEAILGRALEKPGDFYRFGGAAAGPEDGGGTSSAASGGPVGAVAAGAMATGLGSSVLQVIGHTS